MKDLTLKVIIMMNFNVLLPQADTLDTVKKERKRQSLVIDLSGNAQTYLRCPRL